MAPLVGLCGSRSLPAASASPLVARVVGPVLASGRGVAAGCSLGADALVVSSVLAVPGAAPRLSVFCAFGPVSPPWPAPRVSAPGASRSSSVSGVAEALAAGAPVRWWSGGGPAVPLVARLASRSAALDCAVSASGPGAGCVGFVSSPCPGSLVPSRSRSACFSGRGSGSWASLAFAAGRGLPVVVFPVGLAPAACLPSSWGSWLALSGSSWAGGWPSCPRPPPCCSSTRIG